MSLRGSPDRDQMLMNWPERVWIHSPVRGFFQRLEASKWMRQAGRQEVGCALEIGCGPGRGAQILVERMGFEQVVAFDLEEALIRRCVKKLPQRFENRIFFHVADAQDLPFSDAVFDAVVNYGIIHHVLDWRRCIREISRVLRPGGHFYFEEVLPPLYANFLFKRMLRHPTRDRFDGPMFLKALESCNLKLLDTVKTGSKFGLVGVARRL